MHIDRLWIGSFKNLNNFEVDFDVASPRQVVIGRNGVGKSNLLAALTQIFRDLDLQLTPDQPEGFEYEIEYVCNGYRIKVVCEKADDSKFKRFYCLVRENVAPDEDGAIKYESIAERAFYKLNRPIDGMPNPDRILPHYVFGYYSGVVTRFNDLFVRHEERYYKEQISGAENPLRPLFQAKRHHTQFALLAFYATHDDNAKRFLKEEMRILGLESVLFALHEPYWNKSSRNNRTKSGDSRFWNAGGKVKGFLSDLYNHSFAPMSGSERMRVSLGQNKTKERRYCFIPSEEKLRSVAEGLSSREFFARMESVFFSDLVDESGDDLRIQVKVDTGEGCSVIDFSELSEGERQLITVLGLMRFTADKEGLFLLDEPDTHLNPAWCLDYLHNLRVYGAEPPNSQVIMTTHNPLTFAGLDSNEVVIMERQGDSIVSSHPTTAPKGMGVAAILTSSFFGMRSTLDRETLEKIDEKRELGLIEKKTNSQKKRLSELNDELGRLDFSHAARDPLYLEYIRAMTECRVADPKLADPVPDSDSWRKRQRIAVDIAARLQEGTSK